MERFEMTTYEIQLTGGKIVRMSGRTPEHACERAADAHQRAVIAWRTPPVSVTILGDAHRIIG